MYDPDRHDRIENVIAQWRAGMYTQAVFTASLKALGMRPDNITALVWQHRAAFLESLPYKRGDVC